MTNGNAYSVLIHANAPWSGTGYGNQTRTFAPLLHTAGWDVTVSAFYGLAGASLRTEHALILPVAVEQWGNDVLPAHYRHRRPDVMFLLHDIWVLNNDVLDQFPAASWCPVDHQPVPPATLDRLLHCRWTVAMSKFGERQLRAAGLDPLYCPHGVNTDVFKPGDRTEACAKWQVPEGAFFAVTVAANKGNPSRKSLDRLLKAWATFSEGREDAILYLHTMPSEVYQGVNLIAVAKGYGINMETLRFPDTYRLIMGEYTWEAMTDLYNAADVMLLPSMGEGFGIPVIEAEACGCPVIVTDFSAQSELCFGGYKIPVNAYDDLIWTWQDSEQANVKAGEIVKSLEWAYEQRGNPALRQQAHDGAQAYSAQRVFDTYMHPIFKLMAETNRAEIARWIPQQPSERCAQIGHDWSPTGLHVGDAIAYPCRRKTCEAARLVNTEGQTLLVPTGWGMTVNGIPLDIEDDPKGGVAKIVAHELSTVYDLDSIPFEAGDVVLDIGAHVGVVSIYLAKKYPGIQVYAFEPVVENFTRLAHNLQANGVTNVEIVRSAVTGDGRRVTISGDPAVNSGGASLYAHPNGHSADVESTTLADIFERYHLTRVKLLKLDCEGAEHEIVRANPALLERVDYLRGEFHEGGPLVAYDYTVENLLGIVQAHIPVDKVKVTPCPLSV